MPVHSPAPLLRTQPSHDTEGGNQYICVMVDYLTKWAEPYPLKNKIAEEMTNCILDFVYKFGVPQRLLTRQGTEFKFQVQH